MQPGEEVCELSYECEVNTAALGVGKPSRPETNMCEPGAYTLKLSEQFYANLGEKESKMKCKERDSPCQVLLIYSCFRKLSGTVNNGNVGSLADWKIDSKGAIQPILPKSTCPSQMTPFIRRGQGLGTTKLTGAFTLPLCP